MECVRLSLDRNIDTDGFLAPGKIFKLWHFDYVGHGEHVISGHAIIGIGKKTVPYKEDVVEAFGDDSSRCGE